MDEFETMGQGEHFMTTDIIWDPTGRYVVTCVTAVQHVDNGYQIWSFQGRMLYRLVTLDIPDTEWYFLPSTVDQSICTTMVKFSQFVHVDETRSVHMFGSSCRKFMSIS